jgi:hypothetical protein
MSTSKFIEVEVIMNYTKDQIIKMIRDSVGYPDAAVEFDISPKGQIRGISVKVKRRQMNHEK